MTKKPKKQHSSSQLNKTMKDVLRQIILAIISQFVSGFTFNGSYHNENWDVKVNYQPPTEIRVYTKEHIHSKQDKQDRLGRHDKP